MSWITACFPKANVGRLAREIASSTSTAPSSADGESDEADIRLAGKDAIILKRLNVRPREVEVDTEGRLVNGRDEIEEPITRAHRGRRLPAVPSPAVGNHDQHHARGGKRQSSDLQHGNLHPHDAV